MIWHERDGEREEAVWGRAECRTKVDRQNGLMGQRHSAAPWRRFHAQSESNGNVHDRASSGRRRHLRYLGECPNESVTEEKQYFKTNTGSNTRDYGRNWGGYEKKLRPDHIWDLRFHLKHFDVVGAILEMDMSGRTFATFRRPILYVCLTERAPHLNNDDPITVTDQAREYSRDQI